MMKMPTLCFNEHLEHLLIYAAFISSLEGCQDAHRFESGHLHMGNIANNSPPRDLIRSEYSAGPSGRVSKAGSVERKAKIPKNNWRKFR
jgi:hypothetical protein